MNTPWHSVSRTPYSSMGYGGGAGLHDEKGAVIGMVVTLNKSAHHDPKVLDEAVYQSLKDRTAAIRWANQSVEMRCKRTPANLVLLAFSV